MIKRGDDSADRLESRNVPGKGKGIFAKAPIGIGEYVCEYAGDLLQRDEAKARERAYDEEAREAGRTEVMCYMYFFKYNNAEWWYVEARAQKRRESGMVHGASHSLISPFDPPVFCLSVQR